MSEKKEAQLRLDTAEQLLMIIPAEEGVREHVSAGLSTTDFITQLISADLLIDAIRYLAIALPRREAIWWALATHRTLSIDQENSPPEIKAWELVEDWVYNPTEENRAQAQGIAETLDYLTPGSYGAMAVFWSGGSMVPAATGQIVPPGANLTGTAVGASVIMTCAKGDPQKLSTRQKTALEIGLDVAYGGNGLSRALTPA